MIDETGITLKRVYHESIGRFADATAVDAYEGNEYATPSLIKITKGDINDSGFDRKWVISKKVGAKLIREAIAIYDRETKGVKDE